ncbi:MAG TPA: hypothetical protein VGL26_10185 [Jatrophihabitans sp.]|jgi:hypothetical protein
MKTDLLTAYRPLDSEAEAEWSPEKRGEALARILSSPQTEPINPKLTTGRRRWLVTSLTGIGVAAAAAAVLLVVSGGFPGSSGNTSGGNAIELTGYKIVLPANYKIGKGDTNCTTDLHLNADETKRLITTPKADCPLLIKSVENSLPSGALKLVLPAEVTFTIYVVVDGSTDTVYLPAQLPDGSTVYVTVDPTTLKSWASADGSGVVYFMLSGGAGPQFVQLEQGMRVEPLSAGS